MDTVTAFAMGEANRNKEPMVFDWDKAASLIKEHSPQNVGAGLRSDWEWTGGSIYKDGAPVMDDYTYLSSTWATPEIDLDGIVLPCFKRASEVPGWDSSTKWPKSALAILKGE